jgi:hypothetical protein
MLLNLFADSPEYEQRKRTPFRPSKVFPSFSYSPISTSAHLISYQVTLSEIHATVPKHLYQKSTVKGLYYTMRDIFFVVLAYSVAKRIDPLCRHLAWDYGLHSIAANILRQLSWVAYWWWQGVIFAGVWCLGWSLYLNMRDHLEFPPCDRSRSRTWHAFAIWMD